MRRSGVCLSLTLRGVCVCVCRLSSLPRASEQMDLKYMEYIKAARYDSILIDSLSCSVYFRTKKSKKAQEEATLLFSLLSIPSLPPGLLSSVSGLINIFVTVSNFIADPPYFNNMAVKFLNLWLERTPVSLEKRRGWNTFFSFRKNRVEPRSLMERNGRIIIWMNNRMETVTTWGFFLFFFQIKRKWRRKKIICFLLTELCSGTQLHMGQESERVNVNKWVSEWVRERKSGNKYEWGGETDNVYKSMNEWKTMSVRVWVSMRGWECKKKSAMKSESVTVCVFNPVALTPSRRSQQESAWGRSCWWMERRSDSLPRP